MRKLAEGTTVERGSAGRTKEGTNEAREREREVRYERGSGNKSAPTLGTVEVVVQNGRRQRRGREAAAATRARQQQEHARNTQAGNGRDHTRGEEREREIYYSLL